MRAQNFLVDLRRVELRRTECKSAMLPLHHKPIIFSASPQNRTELLRASTGSNHQVWIERHILVDPTGNDPVTFSLQSYCATKLRHEPIYFSGTGRNRTYDAWLFRPTLYLLSYSPIFSTPSQIRTGVNR